MSLSVQETPIEEIQAPATALKKRLWQLVVALVGGIVVVVGIITIPSPVPSLPIMFAGLSIWAIEFHWARWLLTYAKQKYDAWSGWIKQQSLAVKAALLGSMGSFGLVSVWLFNGLGYVNHLIGPHWSWLDSPLPFF